jgi:hypothetical protein
MFVLCGIGALLVWFLRRSLPESSRWLESKGRDQEAEAVFSAIENEVAATRTLPPPAYHTLTGMWVGEKIDRKPSMVALSLAAAGLGLIYPVFIDPTAFVVIGFLLVFTVAMMLALAWGLYIPELFPTELRMRGAGVCNTAGRLIRASAAEPLERFRAIRRRT